MIHHTFYRGKKIIVIMRDGKKLIGKYSDSWTKGIIMDGGKRIPYGKMRSVTILKRSKEGYGSDNSAK